MPKSEIANELGRARDKDQVEHSTRRLLEGMEEMDQDARDDARDALGRIMSHEEVCAQRWKTADATSVRIEIALGALQKGIDERVGKMPASIIAAMAAVIGFLADRAFPFH